MKFVYDLIASFHNKPDGFSARKLSAFTSVVVAIIMTFQYGDKTILVQILVVWLLFALLCLGIITFEQIIKFKNGNMEVKEETKIQAPE